MTSTCRRTRTGRGLAVLLIAGQILISVPSPVLADAAKPKPDAAPAAPKVRVNRTLPRTAPLPAQPEFSRVPTKEEIGRARVFAEPLLALGQPAGADERRTLGAALSEHSRNRRDETAAAVTSFLARHPDSPYRASLLVNAGIWQAKTGYFSKALRTWSEALEAARQHEGPEANAVANRALSELLGMNVQFGRAEELRELLSQVNDADLHGSVTEKVTRAREALWLLTYHHDTATPSAAAALAAILTARKAPEDSLTRLASFPATHHGASFPEVERLAEGVGIPMQMAFREGNAAVPLPAIAHLKVGHYSALTETVNDRYLAADAVLGGGLWFSSAALSDEGSGYFLIPDGPLPAGWRAATSDEAAEIRGKCVPPLPDEGAITPCNGQVGGPCGGGGSGMPRYNVHAMAVSLNLSDTPLGYTPPFGPAVQFTVRYNQRDAFQPQVFTHSNLGQKWTFDWLSYVEDDDAHGAAPGVYVCGGGWEYHPTTAPDHFSGAVLIRTSASPVRYERRLPDGSVEVFTLSDGATPRRVYMTELVDPQGNKLTFTYSGLRMVAARDALGQVTTISYELSDPLKITKVTDPFGRSAHFSYDASGRLQTIIDVIALASSVTYGPKDFITSLITPYGTTHFRGGEDISNADAFAPFYQRYVEATDPVGGRERVECSMKAGTGAEYRTYYWNKNAFGKYGRDETKAHIRIWQRAGLNMGGGPVLDASLMERPALEDWITYSYPSRVSTWPTRADRILDDLSTQTSRWDYNALGHTTLNVDPAGRETVYDYAGNQIDLLRIKRRNGGAYDLLAEHVYNTQHLPLTVTDAAGHTTTLTYNPRGQLRTATNPKNEMWELTYDATGYLQTIAGPQPGATVSFTYDGYGRARTVTNMDGYTVTVDYDLFDRPTRINYPNGTFEEVVYDRLHASKFRDLAGRWSEVFVDPMQRPTAVKDALGRLTTLDWCGCGALDGLIDANGNATRWERDARGRVIKEVRADSTSTSYAHETRVNRLKSVTDAKNQTRTYQYFGDNRLKQISYSGSAVSTPAVAFTFDPIYGRLTTRTDGAGFTTYAYNPVTPGNLSSGRLSSIDGPFAGDLIEYAYDETGAVRERKINGVAASVVYDSLGRVSSTTNALGTFGYTYDGKTSRPSQITYPHNIVKTFAYFDQAGDRQLREITNSVGSTTISRFAYTYLPNNEISTWTQQAGGAAAKRYEFGYDRGDQLMLAVLKDVGTGDVLKRYAYAYDKGENRVSEQVDEVVTASSHNTVNQLAQQRAGGSLRFTGTTTEPALVNVQGKPADVSGTNAFSGIANVTGGTNTVAVAATDAGGSTTTKIYDVEVAGSNANLNYDNNGNLTSDGSRTYTWDAVNRLTAIDQGTHRSEFSYDGFSRRVRIVEKDEGATTSEKRYLWAGTSIVEERDATGANTLKRYFGQGVQIGVEAFYYMRDHLGSVRELVDADGQARTRYEYDPYGRRTKVTGDLDSDFGHTGHFHHAPTGLGLALYRAYDPDRGRWLSRDPIGLAGGINLYAYVGNDPINYVDPLGLDATSFMWGVAKGFFGGLVAGAILGAMAALGPLGVLGAIAIGSYLTAAGIVAAYRVLTDPAVCADDKHDVLGQLVGGVFGGGAGTRGGYRAGTKIRSQLAGNRKSALPEEYIGAKRGPKPRSEGPHNQTIDRRINELANELGPDWEHVGGGSKTEMTIPTPRGAKMCRRPDITFRNRETGEYYHENVGKTGANGEPVPREVDALNDLEAELGTRPNFTPYDL